ncbi:MAG: hypothetical protein R3E95_12850 [Thiolinea sp.]
MPDLVTTARGAAYHLLKQDVRDFTRRRNTRLQIGFTSMPVVSRSTVMAMFG